MASIGIPTETGRMVTRKASDLFVDALENEGVEYVFAVPGEENLDLLESLRKSSIRVVLTRHEQGAGFMAATYGRLTGRAGVCMATLGPGATNLVTPAAYAQLGAFPLVMITGQKPIKKSKQGRFQIVDVVRLMEPTTQVVQADRTRNTIPSLVREAFRLAEEERPGACLLELPEDVAAEETDAPLIAPHPRLYAMASDDAITQAVWLIRNARHPLLMIGAGANRKDAREAIEDFVGACGIPFCATQMGKGVIDERNPLCLGTAALSDGDYIHCAIDRADLVINVGHDAVEKPPFLMEPGGFDGTRRQDGHSRQLPLGAGRSGLFPAGRIGRRPRRIDPAAARGDRSDQGRSRLLHAGESRDRSAPCRRHRRRPVSDDPAAPRRRCSQGDGRERRHRAGQRHVQDLVRAQLSGVPPQYGAARQRRSPPWARACRPRWRPRCCVRTAG